MKLSAPKPLKKGPKKLIRFLNDLRSYAESRAVISEGTPGWNRPDSDLEYVITPTFYDTAAAQLPNLPYLPFPCSETAYSPGNEALVY